MCRPVPASMAAFLLLAGLAAGVACANESHVPEPAASDAADVLPPPGPGDERVVRIRTLIGGRSDLMLTSGHAVWVHIDGSLPGASDASHPEGPYPTTIDGRDWLPRWQGINSDHLAVAAPLPPNPALPDVQIELNGGRGEVSARKVGRALAVNFDDSEHPGSEWYEVTVRVALSSPPPSVSRSFVDMQADREARQAARAHLAEEEARLQVAWQQGVTAQKEVAAAHRALAAAQAEVLHRREAVEDAEYNVDLWLRRQRDPGHIYFGDGTHAVTIPSEVHWLNVWRDRLARRIEELDDAVARLDRRRVELASSQDNLQRRSQIYRALLQAYQAELQKLYLEEFAARRQHLTKVGVKTRAANRARRVAMLDEAAVPGLYTWIENGRELGTFLIEPGGAFLSANAERAEAGEWAVGEDGLRITRDGRQWRFLPGPSDSYLGTCKAPEGARGRKALLRPVPEEAAESGAAASPSGSADEEGTAGGEAQAASQAARSGP